MRIIFVFTVALLLGGCYQNESGLSDTLLYCTENSPQSFNPQISHDVSTLDATTHQLYNRLIKIDPTSNRFIPDLATHWLESEDKLSYTFFLRRNVSFHQTDYFSPKRYFNADDVIFSFNRMLNKNHPFHSVNRVSDTFFFNHPFTNLVSDIIKVDQYTVKFVLNSPDATLLANLAAHYAVIHSQEYAQSLLSRGHPEKIDFYPIGTGPYKFKNFQSSRVTRYLAHDLYWGEKAAVKKLIYDVTPNNTKRYTKLLSGECDVITYPAASQLSKISKNTDVVISSQPTANIALWSFNTSREPFDQVEVRQALSHAVDQKTIVDAVFFESASATDTLLAKRSWAFNPRSTHINYQPDDSLLSLKQRGYDFTKKLTILTPSDNSVFNPNFHKTAELIQANLFDIGIDSEIISLTHAELEKRLLSGDYDTYVTGINIHINDPDNLFRPLLSCDSTVLEGNSSRWCSAQVQELLDSTLIEPSFIKRVRNYYELQKIIQEQRPYFPIAHVLRMDAFNKNISGLLVNPLTGINFQNVRKIEAR
ncbi:ABC transporter substrate-binding protein [Psychromonas aquimarina]|uniref:ABC transporter substrate-binding protein n=1 Tax=Psychromonas aquimarina TaxID=444919 RepID=UPI000416FB33|nr:ABC transporter substrate-binding protein [Psychromonas aquimarina]